MIIQHGSFDSHIKQVEELMVPHWNEVAKHKGLMTLAPDWAKYAALEVAGKLFTVYVLDDNYKLLGYSYNLIDNHLHYKDLVVASNDALYVSPDVRNSFAGLRLMRATRDRAKELGAAMMTWHAKQDSPLDKLLKAKRLQVQDVLYSEPL